MSKVIFFFFVVALSLSSCHEKVDNLNDGLTLDAFSKLSKEKYKLNSRKICANIARLSDDDGLSVSIDRNVRKYYSGGNPFIWINRLGVYGRADSLLAVLSKAGYYGIDTQMLRVPQIEEDLARIRSLDVGEGGDDALNMVMARFEYNLTRAYFRYAVGMRYGFVNPDYVYNRFEKYAVDSLTTRYRQLSDLRIERPDTLFYKDLVNKAFNDSVSQYLSAVNAKGELYGLLIDRLNSGKISARERQKTLWNIERCRWRLKMLGGNAAFDKYVEVNVPSFTLRAHDKDGVLSMRVACGTTDTKTPLLSSHITRMDVNPQWILPKSIAKGIVGSLGYMHRMGMFVYDKKLGKLPPEAASYEKVVTGGQYIIQAGGPKNSLGRIIFRFDNNFSVFLHDTSSPWLFQRANRAVSHGCVRVEKPFELAVFLLGEKDETLVGKLEYSMTVELPTDNDSINAARKIKVDRKRMVNSVSVKPRIPLFITYYTIYFDSDNRLVDCPDVYGYDEVLAEQLKPFMR